MNREGVVLTLVVWAIIRGCIALFMKAVDLIARLTGRSRWAIVFYIGLIYVLKKAADQASVELAAEAVTQPAPTVPAITAVHHGYWASFATHWLIVGGILLVLLLVGTAWKWCTAQTEDDIAYAPRRRIGYDR